MGLAEALKNETVGDMELRPLIAVSPQTPVRDCVAQMKAQGVGCVIIVDGDGKPVGKFTERRMMQKMLETPGMFAAAVSESMYDSCSTVTTHTSVAELIHLMDDKQLRFVCVVDEAGKATALVGQKGVMEFIGEHFARAVKVQEMGSKVSIEQREGA